MFNRLRFFFKKSLVVIFSSVYLHPEIIETGCSKSPADSVAQLVEHNTFNVGVLGSSPSGITT